MLVMLCGFAQGDRYMMKLFRDYVFHQVDTEGQPVLDLAHVIESLNKLEVGSAEKVLLVSRNHPPTHMPTTVQAVGIASTCA